MLVSQQVTQVESGAKQRRSQRVLLKMPVLVQGEAAGGQSVLEEAQTLVVNAHGALITLAMKVDFHQPLLLKNQKSQDQQPGKVVYVGAPVNGKRQVGVEFTQPAPYFWHITFPPEDW